MTTAPVEVTLGNGPRLSFREAMQSPCLACATSPCCTHLLLGGIGLGTLAEVDHALYLLNFEGIYLGLATSFDRAQVYFHQPCGHLDARTSLCTVHSTPAQPAVCRSYKSQACDYRRVLGDDDNATAPLANHARMTWLAEHMVFDADRNLVAGPDLAQALDAFRTIPLARTPAPHDEPSVPAWQPLPLTPKPNDGGPRYRFSDAQVSDPCSGCPAWCCHTLEFDRGLPSNISHLDFLRYSLGFPSVELSIADEHWSLIVHTACRHLQDGRCSLYGSPARPLECSTYDELQCQLRVDFAVPDPPNTVRVTLEQFRALADLVVFDQLGHILAVPAVDVVRDRLKAVPPRSAEVPGGRASIEAITEEGDPPSWP